MVKAGRKKVIFWLTGIYVCITDCSKSLDLNHLGHLLFKSIKKLKQTWQLVLNGGSIVFEKLFIKTFQVFINKDFLHFLC